MTGPAKAPSPVAEDRLARARWRRWALLFGLPSAAVALIAAWLIRPHGLASTVAVVVIALGALAVFVATMPRRAGRTDAGTGSA